MGIINVKVTSTTTAPPQRVYDLLIDRAAVPRWSPMDSCDLEKPAAGDDPDGVGSVRRQRQGKVIGYDTLIELRPPERFAYSHQGLPVRDYRGTVDVAATDNGSTISWQVSFRPKYFATGWLLRIAIGRFVRQCVTGLADHASRP